MVTPRKKTVVSTLAPPRGSLPERFTGQIRENASIIFTNFVCRCRSSTTFRLTILIGHGPFFDPPSGGPVEAVCTTFLVEVSEYLTSAQILQGPKAGRSGRTPLLYGSIWEVSQSVFPT